MRFILFNYSLLTKKMAASRKASSKPNNDLISQPTIHQIAQHEMLFIFHLPIIWGVFSRLWALSRIESNPLMQRMHYENKPIQIYRKFLLQNF